MITPVIYQISEYTPPQYVIDIIQNTCLHYQYTHIKTKMMSDFIKDNFLDEFPNFFDIFTSIKDTIDKIEVFKYYILYLNGGVFLSSNAKLIKNIDTVSQDCDFFSVESIVIKNSIFNGLIGCVPKSIILKTALIKICDNINLLNENKYDLNRELYSIIIDHKSKLNNIKLFKEQINQQFATTIDDDNEVILIHYYKNNLCFIESNDKLIRENIKNKNKNDVKIGITFCCPENTNKMYSNGIHQNTLYFCELLLNIGYDTYLVIHDKKTIDESIFEKIFYDSRFKIIFLSDILNANLDFLVLLSYNVANRLLDSIRYLKTKIVSYCCGNSYIIDSEKVLYNQHKDAEIIYEYNTEPIYDAIWSIPQMMSTNQYYWETIHRCKCVEVPFVWSYRFFQHLHPNIDNYMYKKRDTTNIAIFEPNISIMKWGVPALFVCENSYRISKNINKVYLTNIVRENNTSVDFNVSRLEKQLKVLDLLKDKKIFIESRYNTLYFMSKYADIAVSHQWENPLNYLYLDLAWYGWPIVHNAHLCKDIGYYYEHFNYVQWRNFTGCYIKSSQK